MFNYGQPFTHMGVVTTWHVTDKLNLYNGTINGWDRFIDEHYKWGYIGGFSWTSKDEKTSLAFTCVWGPNQFPSQLPANQPIYPTGYVNVPSIAGLRQSGLCSQRSHTLHDWVFTHKWNDKLTQVIETDQGMERAIPGLGAPIVNGVPQNGTPKQDTWYSFGNWFLYNFSDKFMGVWRSEVFWDTNGARTGKLRRRHVLRANHRRPDQAVRMALDPARGPLRLVAVPPVIQQRHAKVTVDPRVRRDLPVLSGRRGMERDPRTIPVVRDSSSPPGPLSLVCLA